jgi:DNA polymerase-3 subunit beta
MEIGFNASYLLDILKSIDSNDVQFELDQPETAAIVRPVKKDKDDDFFCLLMPLRLAD